MTWKIRGLPVAACAIAAMAAVAAPTSAASRGEALAAQAQDFPVTGCGTYSGRGCASESRRVDLTRPTFSNPTEITNPLFPISRLHSAVLLGNVEGVPLRVETTLLPGVKTIAGGGRRIRTRTSQYVAYLDGRIEEVALDWYAQADDGAVWYLGEDVFNYKQGAVADTAGMWVAGREGPRR